MSRMLIKVFCCLIALFLALPALGLAEAVSNDAAQMEWDLSCVKKTAVQLSVHNSTNVNNAVIDSIPAGAYVKVNGTADGEWKDIAYMKDGSILSGWIESPLLDCVSKIRKTDGILYDVHEKDPDYAKKISEGTLEFDVMIYDDYEAYTAYVNGLGPEPQRKDQVAATAAPTALPVFEPVEQPTAQPVAQATAQPTEAPAAQPTALPAAQPKDNSATQPTVQLDGQPISEAGMQPVVEPVSNADLPDDVKIVALGTYSSQVEVNGETVKVLTGELPLDASVPADKKLAVIDAPRSGKASLRRGASESSGLLKKCLAGTVVTVLEPGDKYTKINYENNTGYILTSCLEFYAVTTETQGTAVLSCDGKTDGGTTVNLRNRPDKGSSKIATWKTGVEVTILSHEDGWYKIEANGKIGFVMDEFVTAQN